MTPDDVAAIRAAIDNGGFTDTLTLLNLCGALEAAWAERDNEHERTLFAVGAEATQRERAERAEAQASAWAALAGKREAALARVRALCDLFPNNEVLLQVRAAIDGAS